MSEDPRPQMKITRPFVGFVVLGGGACWGLFALAVWWLWLK